MRFQLSPVAQHHIYDGERLFGGRTGMDFAARRRNMVEGQLRTNKVIDERLIDAMGQVPRETFVPARLAGIAYVDEDIALGGGKYLMEPMVFARLVQGLALVPGDKALIVGDFSGYASTVLRTMGVSLASEADESPVDAILFAGGVGEIRAAYGDRLAEGGRMVAVVVTPGEPGRATLWRKIGGALSSMIMFDAATPVLPGFEKRPSFAL
jgi:protein-L-isoaspartate(D-aspartate) O-methyltransferase